MVDTLPKINTFIMNMVVKPGANTRKLQMHFNHKIEVDSVIRKDFNLCENKRLLTTPS